MLHQVILSLGDNSAGGGLLGAGGLLGGLLGTVNGLTNSLGLGGLLSDRRLKVDVTPVVWDA
ncbi:hypothetical protein AV521_34420 [Streptomyces sp. IMTB 2501]|uniref:hypothetical protein n=1 Tax=Streptomyces sp. IMTB 2501 TaxID=1776340 RepID=UPI00096D6EBB|nr:hypothetical protein [Streptomyces sp. IMTB 2501]OLZ64715.1 hypothetical protein AV521_34420 [Streptomyces sp. IMTB 2501]